MRDVAQRSARMTAADFRKRFLAGITEDTVQRAIVVFLESLPPPPVGPWWTAVNPIPGKSKAAAGRSKWLGLRPGAPDIVVCWGGRFGGAEVKRPKGGRVSLDQWETHGLIGQAGGIVAIVRSVPEFVDFLDLAFPDEWRRLARLPGGVRPWLVTP